MVEDISLKGLIESIERIENKGEALSEIINTLNQLNTLLEGFDFPIYMRRTIALGNSIALTIPIEEIGELKPKQDIFFIRINSHQFIIDTTQDLNQLDKFRSFISKRIKGMK